MVLSHTKRSWAQGRPSWKGEKNVGVVCHFIFFLSVMNGHTE